MLDIRVAIDIITDPSWDEERFRIMREWAISVPEIVHVTVNTPYPGTETWFTESRRLTSRDYRLFDVQYAVLPTKLHLKRFYEELVKTQAALSHKHLGMSALWSIFGLAIRLLLHGQTNFVQMLWKFNQVYYPERQYSGHSVVAHQTDRVVVRIVQCPGDPEHYWLDSERDHGL